MRKAILAITCVALMSSSGNAGTLEQLRNFLNSDELNEYKDLDLENDIPLIIDLGSTILVFGDIKDDEKIIDTGIGSIVNNASSNQPMCNRIGGPVEVSHPSGNDWYKACDYIPAKSDIHIVDRYEYQNGLLTYDRSFSMFPCGYYKRPPLCYDNP